MKHTTNRTNKMRINLNGKLCFMLTIVSIPMFIYVSVNNFRSNLKLEMKFLEAEVQTEKEFEPVAFIKPDITSKREEARKEYKAYFKYILQWTSPDTMPFVFMGKGQQGFIKRHCKHQNCYVTSDREFLGDYTKFDAIAFAGPEVSQMDDLEFPTNRTPYQKFVFLGSESANNYPVCSALMDGFFNWTWTYRLDSDIRWSYLIVRDKNGTIIGPNHDMNWIKLEDMKPVSEDMKNSFKSKIKPVAWFVSNCKTNSKREIFAKDLNFELMKLKYKIDTFGKCGKYQCSRNLETECGEMIERDFFFYLSLENSFSEDYVTEKLLHALEHKAIPIVYGAANYSRFMPDGAYLNAMELGPKKLAKKMLELIKDNDKYSEYFKWTNHYRYHKGEATVETDGFCALCKMLNDVDKVKEISVHDKFREWWNSPGRCDEVRI